MFYKILKQYEKHENWYLDFFLSKTLVLLRMKISVNTDISVLGFYKYIQIYEDILADILTQNIGR